MKEDPHPAIYCGDFTSEGVVLLAVIPQIAETGAQLSSLHILTRDRVSSDPQNYWLLQLGKISAGKFQLLGVELPFPGGFPKNVAQEKVFLDPVLLQRGDKLTLRVTPRGAPPPLTGLSVIPEWGIISSRRSSRG